MARAGMINLIRRLREMCEAGDNDYQLAGVTYWSEDSLQAILDEKRTHFTGVALTPRPSYEAGVNIYLRYETPWGVGNAIEGPDGVGGDGFRVYDSLGTTIASGFTLNERDLSVVFDADQEGEARYLSGFSYDIRAAAVEVWLRKAAHAWSAINFSADGHRFERADLHKHCLEMARMYGYQGGVKVGKMVRTDLAGSGGENPF